MRKPRRCAGQGCGHATRALTFHRGSWYCDGCLLRILLDEAEALARLALEPYGATTEDLPHAD